MKLIKIAQDLYVIADNLEIQEGDLVFNEYQRQIKKFHAGSGIGLCRKITHSTQPLEQGYGCEIKEGLMLRNVGKELCYDLIKPLSLSEVKELIGEVDVEKKAYEYAINDFDDYAFCGYVKGYNQALEDNKEKKYTEEDLRKAYYYGKSMMTPQNFEKFIKSLQPKTEWDVDFVDGKLKLK